MPNIIEREFIAEFLDLYGSLPALWNLKNKDYYDRHKKNRAYEILVAKYSEMYPTATKEDVKRKLNALRTNYRKELRKQMESLKPASDSVYEPTLWYYHKMDFLRVLESTPDPEADRETAACTTDRNSIIEEDSHESSSSIVNVPTSSTSYRPPRKKPRVHSFEEVDCSDPPQRRQGSADEHRHWALACAADLQKMEPTQQIYAKKAIAEILMEGQLGLLHRDSVKINDPALKAEPL